MIEIRNPHDADLALMEKTDLIPAIIQDDVTGRVLMLGYMNRKALKRTRKTGRVTFWSRSRGELWEKGESSGNTIHVESMALDCDGDALLIRGRPTGPVCHTGSDTCWDEANPPAGRSSGDDADSSADGTRSFLYDLEHVVDARIEKGGDESYTVRLLRKGKKKIAQKVGEEGVEVALEAAAGDDDRLLEESADLLYHLIVMLRSRGCRLDDVERILRARHKG
ncbi:MAG: bifunctional phosphoribosyl-AMP cyclohydrolase/phosphoribosyl-ATP diphosphatase HisIE [Rhodothermales bacterium]|nr:bifunctional phosphoribosyl-AMP cyclohydrolase/phosphoribosyl-ATP diphosphatase HisIE [Rhodothermales bacterium]